MADRAWVDVQDLDHVSRPFKRSNGKGARSSFIRVVLLAQADEVVMVYRLDPALAVSGLVVLLDHSAPPTIKPELGLVR